MKMNVDEKKKSVSESHEPPASTWGLHEVSGSALDSAESELVAGTTESPIRHCRARSRLCKESSQPCV